MTMIERPGCLFPSRGRGFARAEALASVSVRAASDSNPGWQPNVPTSPLPTTLGSLVGRFLWTRGGLAGRDFGGPEVCMGQPGCPWRVKIRRRAGISYPGLAGALVRDSARAAPLPVCGLTRAQDRLILRLSLEGTREVAAASVRGRGLLVLVPPRAAEPWGHKG